MSTPTLVTLSVAAGLLLGVLLGRHWAAQAERATMQRWMAMRQQISERYRPRRDSLESRADSLAQLELTKRRGGWAFPHEVRRLQALQHCVVTFMFSAGGDELELFHATAEGEAGAPLRTGWAYREGGFPKGSVVDVVIPELDCRDIQTMSMGSSKVLFPPLGPEFIPPAPARSRQPTEPISGRPAVRRPFAGAAHVACAR